MNLTPGSAPCRVSKGFLQRENTSHHWRKRPRQGDSDILGFLPTLASYIPPPAPVLFTFVSWLVFFKHLYVFQGTDIKLALYKYSAYWNISLLSHSLEVTTALSLMDVFSDYLLCTCDIPPAYKLSCVSSAEYQALPSPMLVNENSLSVLDAKLTVSTSIPQRHLRSRQGRWPSHRIPQKCQS